MFAFVLAEAAIGRKGNQNDENEVLDENDKSRILEGANLKDDLVKRIKIIKKNINEISLIFKNQYKENFKKYKLKIIDLLNDLD